jgi:hypothetical protein
VLTAILLLTACSTSPGDRSAAQAAGQAAAPDCIVDQGVSAADAEAARSLRTTIEGGPLYRAAAADSEVAACRVTSESGAITLEYSFRDGGSMRVRRDARIEYTSQEVRLTRPLEEMPVAILARAEESAFAGGGCGIDWRSPERAPAADDPTSTETIYRGDVCNCQARVRADASGRVIGLILRSAC